MILVSACLLGHKVKYNGGDNCHELLLKYSARGRFLPICPECLALLPVPRTPMEIVHGTGKRLLAGKCRAADKNGLDTTHYLTTGAEKAFEIARAYDAHVAILKESSPSCGVHTIYDGSFSGRKIKGTGVTTAMLEAHGLTVFSEKDMTVGRLESLIAEDLRRDKI